MDLPQTAHQIPEIRSESLYNSFSQSHNSTVRRFHTVLRHAVTLCVEAIGDVSLLGWKHIADSILHRHMQSSCLLRTFDTSVVSLGALTIDYQRMEITQCTQDNVSSSLDHLHRACVSWSLPLVSNNKRPPFDGTKPAPFCCWVQRSELFLWIIRVQSDRNEGIIQKYTRTRHLSESESARNKGDNPKK